MVDKERLDAHLNNGKREYILCSAIHLDDSKDYAHKPYNIDKGLVFCGLRHGCIIEQYAEFLGPEAERRYSGLIEVQGFLTNKNRFLGRRDAFLVAKESGQIPEDSKIRDLYSEDLW